MATASTADPQDLIVGPSRLLLPGSQQLVLVLGGVLAGISALVLLAALWRRHRRRRAAKAVRRVPVVPVVSGVALAVAAALLVANWPPRFYLPEMPGLPRLFPEQAFFYRDVSQVPVSADSARWLGSLGGNHLGIGACGHVKAGSSCGIPFNLVNGHTPRSSVRVRNPAGKGSVPVPIADPPWIQGVPGYPFDLHYVAIDTGAHRMWEAWDMRRWFGVWAAGSEAEWDLTSLRFPEGRTTASYLPIYPMTLTWSEVAAGHVDHTLRVASPVTSPQHIWPAQNSDGRSKDPDALPMGAWLRLRPDVDLTRFGPQAKVVAQALQVHGMVVSDTGGAFSITASTDARWDDADLASLRALTPADFEVVDASGLMVDPASMEARPQG